MRQAADEARLDREHKAAVQRAKKQAKQRAKAQRRAEVDAAAAAGEAGGAQPRPNAQGRSIFEGRVFGLRWIRRMLKRFG
jgi:hypothetical protein